MLDLEMSSLYEFVVGSNHGDYVCEWEIVPGVAMRWPWRLKQGKFCSHSFYSPSLVSIAANIFVFSSMCLLLMLLQVYTVIDHSGQNPQILALKVVRLEDQNKQIIEGYKNEIQLLKRLQYCPKVIKLHDL